MFHPQNQTAHSLNSTLLERMLSYLRKQHKKVSSSCILCPLSLSFLCVILIFALSSIHSLSFHTVSLIENQSCVSVSSPCSMSLHLPYMHKNLPFLSSFLVQFLFQFTLFLNAPTKYTICTKISLLTGLSMPIKVIVHQRMKLLS